MEANKLLYILFFLITFFSCKKERFQENLDLVDKNEYAKNFSIELKTNDYKINTAGVDIYLPKNFKINRCIVTTTSASAYIDVLGKFNTIVGVCSPKYFFNKKVAEGIKVKNIQDIGNDASLNYEKIIKLKPNLIITNHNVNYEKTLKQLANQGIKILYIEEFREQHPLGKVEYIKLFGNLFHEEQKADSIYNKVKHNYLEIKEKIKSTNYRPSVFTNIMYGGAWYMAGGESFIAQVFKDAGANYLWSDISKTGTIPLSFEEVFIKAKNADYWIGASNFKSKVELGNSNAYYKEFSAYKNDKIYGMNERENEVTSANDYYEMGNIYADKILSDVVKIIHPELLPNYQLTYFKKIK